MKIGIEIDWQRTRYNVNRERLELVDELGYDMVFTAEGNGSDALTPLGYTVAATKRIGVGSRVCTIPARSPVACAMAFQTLRHMAGPERTIIAGLGNSFPSYVEGWLGVPWQPAYWRMRDYVTIMRMALKGEPVDHQGRTWSIPYTAPDAPDTGEPVGWSQTGPPFSPLLEPDAPVSIVFGGGTEMMTIQAAEIADGLLPNGSWSPGMMKVYRPLIERGFAKAGRTTPVDDFPIWAHVDVLITDDVQARISELKEYTARWCGGWDSKETGGLYTHMAWRGYGDAADRIFELYKAGRIAEAEAAVPDEYVDECWLIGSLPRILERWRSKWVDDGCNLVIRTDNWPSAKQADNSMYEPLIRAMREN